MGEGVGFAGELDCLCFLGLSIFSSDWPDLV